MLRSLYIENVAVARRIDWELRDGFTVLTGETGAGKSVMIDCLELLLGGRFPREMLRLGAERATVSAIFTDVSDPERLRAAGVEPDEEGEVEIVRTLGADGRTALKINRRSVPLSVLREIGPALLSIQTQNGARGLLDASFHLTMLDAYAGSAPLRAAYAAPYAEWQALQSEANALRESLRQKNMLVDILRYQVKEIDAAHLSGPEEEEKLLAARTKIRSWERIAKYSGFVYRALAQSEKGASASVLLQKSAAALRQLADVMPKAEEMAARLENYRYEIEDIGEEAHALLDEGEITDPEKQLNTIENRLSLIERLKRKYGETIPEILAFRRDAASKLADLENGDEKLSDLEARVSSVRQTLAGHAAALSDARRTAAARLGEAVTQTLAYLDMPKARFTVDVRRQFTAGQEKFGPDGADEVTFCIAANPGEEPQPLGRVASGGEMSRVLLALRCALHAQSGADTLVFDEIDAGVSGGTSERIGIKLKELSSHAQLLCVTHSPQIASLADTHLRIRKIESDGRAESVLETLDAAGRVAEIARIIGGISVTETQRDAAREMVEKRTPQNQTEKEPAEAGENK